MKAHRARLISLPFLIPRLIIQFSRMSSLFISSDDLRMETSQFITISNSCMLPIPKNQNVNILKGYKDFFIS